MSNAHVWRAALSRLQREVTGAQLNTWLRGAQLVSVNGGEATVHVRSTFEREMIASRYHDLIERALSEVVGEPIRLTIATAPGGSLSERPGSARSAARGAAAKVAYERPLFFLEDDAAGVEFQAAAQLDSVEPADALATSSLDASARRQDPVAQLRMRQRIPESPTINSPRASDGRGREHAGQGNVTAGARRTPYGESGAPTSGAGASFLQDRTSQGRNVAGEMTNMSDETQGRYETPRNPEPNKRSGQGSSSFGARSTGASEPSDSSMGVAPLTPPRLNQRYTFSTFIVGSGNQLAHAASQAVADAPGYAYNPLFLYGGVGLGKTHLLHAIGHTALERNLTVLYVSSETFTNEIVNAILYRKTEEFRAKYRSVDVLLVDDIQFIAGKDSTEEEFFHTFNSLYETNRQIVICSDRPPRAIVTLEERLRSRFEWGLIADIQPPDLETRIAILRAKAEVSGRHTPDEVILYVANRVQSNIRELEGSMNRVMAFADLQGLPMTIETAKAAMASLTADTRQRRVSIDDILNAVAEYYHIQVVDLIGKKRDKNIVVPRHVAMYLMRQETEASLQEIGQALGGRDHSTVLHGCENITREVNENTTLRKEVMAIRQQLLG